MNKNLNQLPKALFRCSDYILSISAWTDNKNQPSHFINVVTKSQSCQSALTISTLTQFYSHYLTLLMQLSNHQTSNDQDEHKTNSNNNGNGITLRSASGVERKTSKQKLFVAVNVLMTCLNHKFSASKILSINPITGCFIHHSACVVCLCYACAS